MTPARFVQFATRSDAYAFVAELRRMTDLATATDVRVHDTDRGMLVAVPAPVEPFGGMAPMAERFAGRLLSPELFDSLAAAIEAARATARTSQDLRADALRSAAEAAAARDASRLARDSRRGG